MAAQDLLQAKVETTPIIYAYSDTRYPGALKVGFTTRPIEVRMHEHYPTVVPNQSWNVELVRPAMRNDGTTFDDHAVHRVLRESNIRCVNGEWYKCDTKTVERAIRAVVSNQSTIIQRDRSFTMRDEQAEAVRKTSEYFFRFYSDPHNHGFTPHFLWNAKMRFGKTFTTYQLALRMHWRRVLVLTFKPAVRSAWKEDLLTHRDFEGWQFCEKQDDRNFAPVNERKPFVCFASFQDVLGRNENGGIKATNEWLQDVDWDCIVLDEYHFGAWGKRAKEFYDKQDIANLEIDERQGILFEDSETKERQAIEDYDEQLMPLTTRAYLYLSGTPFRAIASGEFIEEQIFNWTYSDEQDAKAKWDKDGYNPYAALPRMVMMTYQLPDSIREIALQGEFNEFDLNEFFRAEGNRFVHEEYVQHWLEWIRGSFAEQLVTDLKLQTEKPPVPYSDFRLKSYLQHTFWFLPSVAACKAMKHLLQSRANSYYHDYRVILAAGNDAGMGADALNPVYDAMDNPQETKTITLSCGKLSTGVTVRPWSGIFMLRNSSSPETYFQAAFRVQSPWTTQDEYGKEQILKPVCYVFDFAPDRAIKQVADYSCRLNINEDNPETKVGEFIKFLPILAYDGNSMKEIDAAGILDMAMSGTTSTLLARRWESALLVNVDNATLLKLMGNVDAMRALQNIEGFRALRQDIETIINKSEQIKKAKKQKEKLTERQKKELTEEEKKTKSLRKQIQEKLIKFATRIPVFMYLTDFREYCLRDVITQLEPDLFRKVTGLTIADFELLISLNVFNAALMNDAVYKFKRYEDSSLSYTGIQAQELKGVGLYDTVIYPQTKQQVAQPAPIRHPHKPKQETASTPTPVSHVHKAGDNVFHKTFGAGSILSIDEKYVICRFEGNREKKFLYPQVFEQGYLH
ncbi:MAG: GIY-YIG nuclease family protein [Paludibacteraceae bacterium]|nr:GIY-YIG nuclease family protein [Paludibacteraceae bacterium]